MVDVGIEQPAARLSTCSFGFPRSELLARAYRILQDRDEAEDVLHDVVLAVLARDPTLQDTPLSYLRAAVRNRAIDAARQHRLHARLRERERQSSPDIAAWDADEIDQRHIYAAVVRCVRDLPEPERAVAKLHYWEGMTCRRIAPILRIRERSVERVLARARRKISDACGLPS